MSKFLAVAVAALVLGESLENSDVISITLTGALRPGFDTGGYLAPSFLSLSASSDATMVLLVLAVGPNELLSNFFVVVLLIVGIPFDSAGLYICLTLSP